MSVHQTNLFIWERKDSIYIVLRSHLRISNRVIFSNGGEYTRYPAIREAAGELINFLKLTLFISCSIQD